MNDRPLRILLPPGIGDAHWVLMKLRAFCAARSKPRPRVWSMCVEPWRRRSHGFLSRVPFIEAMGDFPLDRPAYLAGLPNGINKETRDEIPGLFGFDHYISFCKSIPDGRSMSEILPGYATEWDYPVEETPEDARFREEFRSREGPYILLYFSDYGMHRKWADHFGQARIRRFLLALREAFGERLVLFGMPHDQSFASLFQDLCLSMMGRTSTTQLMALIRGARAMVGFHIGPTIIGPHLGTPTVMLWSTTHFGAPRFRRNWVEGSRNAHLYWPLEVEGLNDDALMGAVAAAMKARTGEGAA